MNDGLGKTNPFLFKTLDLEPAPGVTLLTEVRHENRRSE